MAPHSSILAWGMLWTEESGVSFVHGVAKSWTQLKLLSTHVHAPQMASMCSRAKIISETFYFIFFPTMLSTLDVYFTAYFYLD